MLQLIIEIVFIIALGVGAVTAFVKNVSAGVKQKLDDRNLDKSKGAARQMIDAFSRDFNEMQKRSILLSLLAIGGADGKFSDAENEYIGQAALLLGFDLKRNKQSVLNINGDTAFRYLNTMSRKQKEWFVVTSFGMAHVDDTALWEKEIVVDRILNGIGITDVDAFSIINKAINAVDTFSDIHPNPSAITGIFRVVVGAATTLNSFPEGGVWSSNNVRVATVNRSTGIVRGTATGTATITYTVAGGSVTAIITVFGGSPFTEAFLTPVQVD